MDRQKYDEFTLNFAVEPDLEGGAFVASWDDPQGGGITTQADTLPKLVEAIKEAIVCHFMDVPAPRRASLRFTETELQLA